jgi:molecular chaperone DnaJ
MAQQVKDYYAMLELEKDCTSAAIKNSYRQLSKKYHPDVCQEENAREIFQKIVEAYEVLSDPESRKEYDEFAKAMNDSRNVSFEDIYGMFHSGIVGAHAPLKGDDVETQIEFTVSEVRQGTQKQMQFERYVNCEDCAGHGFERKPVNACYQCKGKGYTLVGSKTPFGDIKTESSCSVCKGKGYLNIENCAVCKGIGKKCVPVRIVFNLPKDTTDGYKLTLKGKGDTGINGGRNGDLILNLVQSFDDPFKMENDYDLKARLDVPFVKSLTGGNVQFILPRGEVMTVPIARGTQSGDRIVVPEEGLFNPNNGFYGTVTLEVNILVPSVAEDKIQKLVSILG